jgi:hypothetical protein
MEFVKIIDLFTNSNNIRYHTMDCLSIQSNSKDGHYWTNASNFFYGNYAHGFQYFKQLADELKKNKPNFANVDPEENFQQRKEQFRDVSLFCFGQPAI